MKLTWTCNNFVRSQDDGGESFCPLQFLWIGNATGAGFFLDLIRYFHYYLYSKMAVKSFLCMILGWILPGLGHVVLKKFWRALIFFVCITGMFSLGLLLEGRIYSFQTENPLTILGFFSDLGIGLYYFLSKTLVFGLGNLKSTTFEFGTAYIAGAGLLNYLVALDAFDIASGKKK